MGNDSDNSSNKPSQSLVALVRSGRNAPIQRSPIEYGEDVRRLAFEIWLLRADRNCTRAARLLAEELAGEMEQFPSDRVVRQWRREDEWELKAQEAIKEVAPLLNERHFLRLFAATEQAEKAIIDIIHNDHPEPDARRLQVIKDAALELLRLRGLGTAGGYAPPAIPHATVRLDENTSTPQELSRQIRELILEERQHSAAPKGRGRG
jgi:hypothetical protein